MIILGKLFYFEKQSLFLLAHLTCTCFSHGPVYPKKIKLAENSAKQKSSESYFAKKKGKGPKMRRKEREMDNCIEVGC